MKLQSKPILIITLLVFIVGITYFSNQHNHSRDLEQHNNCPACLFSTTAHSFTISFNNSVEFDLPLKNQNIDITLPSLKSADYSLQQKNRAPPANLS